MKINLSKDEIKEIIKSKVSLEVNDSFLDGVADDFIKNNIDPRDFDLEIIETEDGYRVTGNKITGD